jgi:4-hydroxy-2-oxoheptanedioate aldolase
MHLRNPVAQKLRAGEVSVGAWLNLASPMVAEVLASEGYEWLVVDMEHGPWSLAEAVNAFRAAEARGAVPMARTWTHDPEIIGRILDAGALGIVAPHVSTPQQAEALVQAVRYPPQGGRSQGSGRAVTFSDYYQQANESVLLVVQIEDPEGVENIERIMSVPGVDVGFLGPNDLALAMGLTRDQVGKSPELEAMLVRVLEGCRRVGKPAGIPAPNAEAANKWIARGFQFIDLSSDLRLLQGAAGAQLRAVQRTPGR